MERSMKKDTKTELNYQAPMYLQLREIIRTKIEDEEYGQGQAIPSENALAKQYGLNRMTVRNAISALINEGLLISVHGKGVYVIGNKEEKILQTEGGFQETISTKDPKWEFKVFLKTIRKAGAKYARIFDIDPESCIYFIRKLYYLNGEPYSIEESHIPDWVVPTMDKIDLSVFTFKDIYTFNHIKLVSQSQTLCVGLTSAMDARMLKLSPGVAVLVLDMKNYNDNNRVVEFTRVFTRADKCNFKVKYRRG